MKPTITMIGTGYVGLVSGTCFAEMGFDVTCVDIDAEKIRKLSEEGIIPIFEPGLEEVVKRNIAAGRLKFTTDLSTCVPSSDVVFIAVGTPQDEDGSADMKYVLAAAEEVAKHISGFTVIVDKSTVPVGTGKRVREVVEKTLNALGKNDGFDVCSNPEFLREGEALGDFSKPDRIVVGAEDARTFEVMRAVYKPQTDEGYPLFECNVETAELIKYAANAFLAAKITFINEVAGMCEVVGANVEQVSQGLGLDSRIGAKFLHAGPGYGGSCFPKDTNAMAFQGREWGCPQTIVEQTIKANEAIKERMADKVEKAWGQLAASKEEASLKGVKIAVLGLAFKAGTDDMRDAPALTILPELEKRGAKLQAYDPEAMEQAKSRMPKLAYFNSMEEALQGADLALILTEWEQFRTMDTGLLKSALTKPILVDLRNLFEPKEMAVAGINYHSIGRKVAEVSSQKQEEVA